MNPIFIFFALCFSYFLNAHASEPIVDGKNFKISATQQIHFIPLQKIDSALFLDSALPKIVNLKEHQSSVKDQGARGSCTYFTITSMIESLIKQSSGKELDLSEEYLAWASKVKKKMRVNEEDSSVAVNAATIQEFGFLLEEEMPYQLSWFNKGGRCENQKTNIDPACFSHDGPNNEVSKNIRDGSKFIFEAVDSSSIDLVRALAKRKNPVTLSILGHPDMWKESWKTGDLILTPRFKTECEKHIKPCSGHAILVVGYDIEKKIFLLKNSWGPQWGAAGYGTISFDYIDQMSPRKFITSYIDKSLN